MCRSKCLTLTPSGELWGRTMAAGLVSCVGRSRQKCQPAAGRLTQARWRSWKGWGRARLAWCTRPSGERAAASVVRRSRAVALHPTALSAYPAHLRCLPALPYRYGTLVAAKILKGSNEVALGDFRGEIEILRRVHHPNAVQVLLLPRWSSPPSCVSGRVVWVGSAPTQSCFPHSSWAPVRRRSPTFLSQSS